MTCSSTNSPLPEREPPFPRRASSSLEVHLLGQVEFDAALFLQERLVYEVSGRNDICGTLLVCEHPPMITIGREGSRAHVLVEPRELTARQMDVRWLNRGGGALVHAPGQLAVYPVLPLGRLGLGMSEYRRRLEQSVISVARELRVAAWSTPDQPGARCRLGQFAHVGAAVKSWVSYHGMFINVSPASEFLRMTKPGPGDVRVTSLAAQRQAVTPMAQVRESVVRNLAERLGYPKYHVYTGHPLLRRTLRRVYVPA